MFKLVNNTSLYVNSKKEFLSVLTWVGVIIFWLTFWLPQGVVLGGNPTILGSFFPQMEVVIPAFSIGILLVFIAQFFLKLEDESYLKPFLQGFKMIGLWFVIMLLISLFSRDVSGSLLFMPVFLLGFMLIPVGKFLLPNSSNKKALMAAGILTGFVVYHYFPELNISLNLLSLTAVFGLIFCTEDIPRNARSKEFFMRFLTQFICLFVVFQSGNIIFPLSALFVLIFSQKIFFFRRGGISPDFLGLLFMGAFFVFRMYFHGLYEIEAPTFIPNFWTHSREIFFGVGQGQFLPALQKSSEYLLPLSQLLTPNSSVLLILFEKGVLGVFAMLLLFVFSHYLHRKRSFLYIFLVILLFLFSSVFFASENGIIIFIFLLFLDYEKINSRENI